MQATVVRTINVRAHSMGPLGTCGLLRRGSLVVPRFRATRRTGQLGHRSLIRPKRLPRATPLQTAEDEVTSSLVDDVLERIKDSDSGAALAEEERASVDDMLDRLEEVGDKAPLDNPLLWGNYNVSYVSAGKSQQGNPAGGRFRGKLGKALFQTTVLEQNLYAPDVVVNKVGFKLLGFIPGQVTLKGSVTPEPADQKLWVRAKFEPPQIAFMGLPSVSIGPKSSVVLATQYLDERIRLGKGSRGSYFVFTRKEGDVNIPEPTGTGWGAIAAVIALVAAVATGLPRILSPTLTPWVVGAAVILSIALALVLRSGGIVDDEPDAPSAPIEKAPPADVPKP
eukprot:CAMPEP_0118921330 /NCGR_PEP_ID=MMETSP1169-20130426/661_1 /TAXON_ID=36882 /ORGANISM="Pyramimonas obovata, Strain CCMP722" /LENGTH=337 /DNA_ID=CAMNT_0006862043 /DNA_START=68 /DNA_END=1081 /DNA_ORIENTATION=-